MLENTDIRRKSLKILMISLILLTVVLTGCGQKDDITLNVEPFDYVRWVRQTNGLMVAEAYISALDKSSRLDGDAKQDVVVLLHKEGRMALPDTVTIRGWDRADFTNPHGVVPISVYHLLDQSGEKEIGYYKRRFARSK